ncbi:MAG: IS1595 family transposase [Janthinobacterium lividum]
MNLIDVTRELGTEDDCLAFLEAQRWPDGVIRCTTCGCSQVSKITRTNKTKEGKESKNKRTRIYQCLEKTCKQQFSATSGTIYNDTHLPLTKWFMAIALIVDAKKGMSAKQLQQHLGIGSYKTAWYLGHRIRKAMEAKTFEKMTGTVEIDETYIGGAMHPKGGQDGRKMRYKNKETVLGMRERGGRLRLKHIPNIQAVTLGKAIKDNVSTDVDAVMTDDNKAYIKAFIEAGINGRKHFAINHSAGKYVDGMVYTNTIESAFSLLKRGVIESFHRISIKHLHRYLSEFEYRFNARKAGDRFSLTVGEMMRTTPMEFKQLTAGV